MVELSLQPSFSPSFSCSFSLFLSLLLTLSPSLLPPPSPSPCPLLPSLPSCPPPKFIPPVIDGRRGSSHPPSLPPVSLPPFLATPPTHALVSCLPPITPFLLDVPFLFHPDPSLTLPLPFPWLPACPQSPTVLPASRPSLLPKPCLADSDAPVTSGSPRATRCRPPERQEAGAASWI